MARACRRRVDCQRGSSCGGLMNSKGCNAKWLTLPALGRRVAMPISCRSRSRVFVIFPSASLPPVHPFQWRASICHGSIHAMQPSISRWVFSQIMIACCWKHGLAVRAFAAGCGVITFLFILLTDIISNVLFCGILVCSPSTPPFHWLLILAAAQRRLFCCSPPTEC